MAILGSMLAYLGVAAGIVAALMVSVSAFFYSPAPSTSQQIAAVAKPSEPKAATPSARGAGRWGPRVAPAAAPAVMQQTANIDARRKAHLAALAAREQHQRLLEREQRARAWADQQAQNAPRVLGYAQEPGEYDRFR